MFKLQYVTQKWRICYSLEYIFENTILNVRAFFQLACEDRVYVVGVDLHVSFMRTAAAKMRATVSFRVHIFLFFSSTPPTNKNCNRPKQSESKSSVSVPVQDYTFVSVSVQNYTFSY